MECKPQFTGIKYIIFSLLIPICLGIAIGELYDNYKTNKDYKKVVKQNGF